MTTQELNDLIAEHPKNQTQIGEDIGFNKSKMSRLVKGANIDESDSNLLNLYFKGIMPFEMLAPIKGYDSSLDFDKNEWRVLGIIARRNGYNDTTKWIVQHIREYLAFLESQKAPNITPLQDVAEDEVYYESDKKYPFEILTSLAAGSGITSDNVDTIHISKEYPKSYKGARVRGESMESDDGLTIPDGSIAVIDTKWEGRPFTAKDNIYAWVTDDGDMIKKFVRRKVNGKTQGFLESLNPNFEPIPYDESMIPQGQFIETLDY